MAVSLALARPYVKRSFERDNDRVNRADAKCKLVKMESDTMGACDHPTTGQPEELGRFGSTLCYPATECFALQFYRLALSKSSTRRN